MAAPAAPLVTIALAEFVGATALLVPVAMASIRAEDPVAPAPAQIGIWAVVVAALGITWLGLYRRRRAARAPFVLVQCFVLVVAWAFLGSDSVLWQILGVAAGATAAAGLALALRPAVSGTLH